MARDTELDRLGTAQALAFQRKQSAYRAQGAAWQRRSRARDELNQAHEEKRSAYAVQDASWQAYLQVRSYNRPRIDRLYSQQEVAFQNMKAAFGRASGAYDMRDYASARRHADEGHSYRAEARGYVAERRGLDQEIRNARDGHEATMLAFQRAKENCSLARRAFDQAKAEHECAQAEFIRVKADCDQVALAFHQRLEVVRAEAQRKRDEKRAIAERAGVPAHYCDNVWLSTKPDGTVNIYFGGIGEPDGPGHGHYAVDKYGNVTYRRDPFNPHGAHNVVRDLQLEGQLAKLAIDAFYRDRSSTGSRQVQYNDGHVTVKVKSGYNRRTSTVATDIIVIDRANSPNEHLHLILSEHDGSILFSEWRRNH